MLPEQSTFASRSPDVDAKIIIAGGVPLADLMRREYEEALYLGINLAMSAVGNCYRGLNDEKIKAGVRLCAEAVQKLILEKEPGRLAQTRET